MTTSIYSHVAKWIKKISIVHEKLDGNSICPYAKKARWHVVQSSDLDVDPVLIKKQVCIFVVPDSVSKTRLNNYCKKLKKLYPDYVWLPDHKTANTKIAGYSTGNGKYNLILAQKRKPLTLARKTLERNTSYYDNLSKKYKKELWSY